LRGVATSLLFRVFEAWLIWAHSDGKIDKSFLSSSSSSAAYGNSITAIMAGLLANKAAPSTDMLPMFKDNSILFVGCHSKKETALNIAVGVFAVASVAVACVAFAGNGDLAFTALNVFEMCVGMYFPVMGPVKGAIVPKDKDKRAAMYNLYRIPLNFIVLFSLFTDLTPTQSFLSMILCSQWRQCYKSFSRSDGVFNPMSSLWKWEWKWENKNQ
jgi:Sugar-tranasporters, 12 TM